MHLFACRVLSVAPNSSQQYSIYLGIAAFGNAPSALIPATALITLIGGISAYTFSLIARVCAATDTNSYSDAWDVTVGKSTSALIAFSCFIDCFAGNLSYRYVVVVVCVQ
jgi:hypothetical protein